MEEIWKECGRTRYGWNHNKIRVYEISNYGNVRCDGKLIEVKERYTTRKKKYVNNIRKAYKRFGKGWSVHRLVAELFIPNPENKKYVDHIDGNIWNNHVNNLRWVTNSENMRNPNTYRNLVNQMKSVCSKEEFRTNVSNGCKKSFIDRPERRLKCATQTGKRWMNNKIIQRFVTKENIDTYLKNGWVFGRLPFTEEHKNHIRESLKNE